MGLLQNWAKANELYLKAGELGCANSYYKLGLSYDYGYGVAVDEKKAKHYHELAAIGGDISARYNLGVLEEENGNLQQAMKHYAISAKAGDDDSLESIKEGYVDGYVTKEEYAQALRAYQKSQDEMKSEMRDNAHKQLT